MEWSEEVTPVPQIGRSPGASEDQIRASAESLGLEFPGFYAEVLRECNGFTTDKGLLLYSAEDLAERNETFEVRAYAPGFLAIGDDSGGRSILIALDGSATVYIVDQGSMDPDEFIEVSPDLLEWLHQGAELP
ncbi:MAG TPA: SMI1/KNR4 family protein [Longimicrobium sp.]|nr:SMI1/KNR4 family protein [Longimicrobium sp.]